MNIRVNVPVYVRDLAEWPLPLANFGVKNTGEVRFRQKAVGEYTADEEYFIGIVSPAQFQPPTPITYTHFGTVVRFITVTLAGIEEHHTSNTSHTRFIVSPESRSALALEC
jgi:hypothetical protein